MNLIVEGENDRKEVYSILKTPFFDALRDNYRIEFIVTKGDITSRTGNDEHNIIHEVGKQITSWIKNSIGVKHSDIQRVIQIVDMDGAFIPSSNVIKSEIYDFYYDKDALLTLDVSGARNRNKRKSSELKKLSVTKEICNIQYCVYYVSCNMDHTLFNNSNMQPKKKNASQYWFLCECERNPRIIFESVLSAGVAAEGTYLESWEWIQIGSRSLKRHTNFNLFLSENMNDCFDATHMNSVG